MTIARSEPVSTEIVRRIATREGVSPVDLDTPLYEVIDGEAMEALVNGTKTSPQRTTVRLAFRYYGYTVSVDGTGDITIDEGAAGDPTDERSTSQFDADS